VSGTIDSRLVVWDLERARPLRESSIRAGSVIDIEVIPNGSIAVAGTNTGQVCFWGLSRPEAPRCRRTSGEAVYDVAVGTDGTVALGTTAGVELWDPVTMTPRGRPNSLAGPGALAVAFSGDGAEILSVDEDGFGRITERRTGRSTARYEVAYGGGSAIRYSRDARRIAVTGGRTGPYITVSETRGGREVASWGDVWADDVEFTPDGQRLVFGGSTGIRVVSVAGASSPRRIGSTVAVFPLAVSEDGRRVLAWSENDGMFRLHALR
jgi:WD40 repeat protein